MSKKVMLFAAVLPFWAFLLILPRSTTLQSASVKAELLAIRAWRFPSLAGARDKQHCTLSDSWRETIDAEDNAEQARLSKVCKRVRSEGPYDLVETPSGPYWIPARDFIALAEMLEEQERDVYQVESGGVKPGDVVLDCGANVGVYTRKALKAGASLVVSIEPAPENLECLRKTFAAEVAAGKVVIYSKGVWDRDEVLEITTSPTLASTANSVAINRGASGPKIQLTTIDKMVAELKLPHVDSIKMDIEGAEGKALAGGKETIAKYHPRTAISLEHRHEDLQTIPALIKTLWADRLVQCGPCRNVFGHIQPEVAFVR
jgi:FkbM family methyltransferase